MKPLFSSLVMTLLSVLTGAAVLTLVISVELYFSGLDYFVQQGKVVRLQNFFLLGIVPIAPLFIGLLASSGYYIGGRLAHFRPEGIVLGNMLLFGVLIFLAMHWLHYRVLFHGLGYLEGEFRFAEFFYRDIFELELQMRTKSGRAGRILELNWFGAVLKLVVLGSYLTGPYIVYRIMRMHPYCASCGQYMVTRQKQRRFPPDEGAIKRMIGYMQELQAAFDQQILDTMLHYHADQAEERRMKDRYWRSILWHKECAGCGADCLEFQGYRQSRRGWTDVGDRQQLYPPCQIVLVP